VVGRAFVAEGRRAGQRIVHGKCFSSLKMARSARADWACSKARCSLLFRLAAVKCRRSALSADGLTVAALAVHIGEAEYAHASITGDSFAALASTSASVPVKPTLRSRRKLGRSCGGSSAWPKPRAASARILARPCKAASLGLDALLTLLNEATLPNDRPA
jgi:hypothetical protein